MIEFYRHGWHSFSPSAWFDAAFSPVPITHPELIINADDPVAAGEQLWSGSGVGALAEAGEVRLLGSLDLDSRVRLEDGSLVGLGEASWLQSTGTEEEVWAAYTAALAEHFGRRSSQPGPIWCSWYSFAERIDEVVIEETLDDVSALPFRCFQVDAGWERMLGDWEPGTNFPSGMTQLASRIEEAGLVPGLWLAPFAAHRDSELIRSHPEFLLRDDEGSPVRFAHNWGPDGLALDVARSDVTEWVGELIAKVRLWGFRYLKLDFLYAGAFPGRTDRNLGREASYRRAVEAIRSAAGEDCFLLACGAPILASIGVFDAIRVGPDVAPYWEDLPRTRWLNDWSGPGVRQALATSINRLWLQPVIGTDPDVAFFRSKNNLLTANERSLQQSAALIAGYRATSDPPSWLEREELAALEDFLVAEPTIMRHGRYRFEIDDTEVDFSLAMP